jgi:hypothetical protein
LNRWYWLLIALVGLVGCNASVSDYEEVEPPIAASHAPLGDGSKPNLLVPLYVFPNAAGLELYEQLANLQEKYPDAQIVAVMNANFDWDNWTQNLFSYRDNVRKAVQLMNDAGVMVIGYVSSSYTRRPFEGNPSGSGFASDVKTTIDHWVEDVPGIRGIFVDEMCNQTKLYVDTTAPCVPYNQSTAPLVQQNGLAFKRPTTYYRSIFRYVRQTLELEVLVANPGIKPHDYFFQASVADAIVTHEGPWSKYNRSKALFGPSRMTGILVYDQPALNALSRLQSLVGQTSLVYLTDDQLISFELNPWDTLSTYLEELMKYLAEI